MDYAYDAVGNETAEWGSYASLTIPLTSGPNTYNADNALAASGSTSYTYDNNGNMTGDGTSTYTWNARNQLTGITGPNTASYTYDSFGRRETTSINGTTTNYLYDGSGVVQELTGGNPTVNYLLRLGGGARFSRTDTSGTSSYLTDVLGSAIGLAGSAGTEQTSYTYDPFGKVTANGAASGNTYQYAGQSNYGTGLNYALNRYYNPTTSQFTSADPAGLSGTNPYAYANDNPVNFTDPTGTSAVKDALYSFGDWASSHWELIAGAAALLTIAILAPEAIDILAATDTDLLGAVDTDLLDLTDTLPDLGDAELGDTAEVGSAPVTGGSDFSVQIFRNVDSAEFDSIADTDKFATGEGQMEGKWFATTGEDAEQWGRLLNPNDGITVETNIPSWVADQLYYNSGKLDGIGPGYYANSEQLGLINEFMDGIRDWP